MKMPRDNREIRNLLDHALGYAARGWPVIPLHTPNSIGLCSCGDLGCRSIGKHPRNHDGFECGRKAATRDEREIRDLWQQWPDANIGIRTGLDSGILVMEVGRSRGGEDSLKEMIDQNGLLPHTPEAHTGNRARHFYFRHPLKCIQNRLGIRPGINVWSSEGYVVAPPSLDASGKEYRWNVAPDNLELATVPGWLHNCLGLPKRSENLWKWGACFLEKEIVKGWRIATLTSLAENLWHRGVDRIAIESALLEANFLRCRPPLHVVKIKKIVESIIGCTGESFTHSGPDNRKQHGKQSKRSSSWEVRIFIR
jgi:hypothetical protein